MDAGRNVIPIVDDDQGEGFMDPIENDTMRREAIREKKLSKLEAQFEQATTQGRKLDAARIMKRAQRFMK